MKKIVAVLGMIVIVGTASASRKLTVYPSLWAYYTANQTYLAEFEGGGEFVQDKLGVDFSFAVEMEKGLFKSEAEFEPEAEVQISYEGIPVRLIAGIFDNPTTHDIGSEIWRNFYAVPLSIPWWAVVEFDGGYSFYLVEPDFLDEMGAGAVLTYFNDSMKFDVSAGYLAGPDAVVFTLGKSLGFKGTFPVELNITAGFNYGFSRTVGILRDEESSGPETLECQIDNYIVGYFGLTSTLEKLKNLSVEYYFDYYSFQNSYFANSPSASGLRNTLIFSIPVSGFVSAPAFLHITKWNAWTGWSGLFGRSKIDVWNHIFIGTTAEFFKLLTFSMSHTVAFAGSGSVRHRFRVEFAVKKEFVVMEGK